MEHAPGWLINSLIYLGAAVLVVPLSKALGLGAIIGYLVAGIAIGPWGLGLVTNVEDILHFAEFGVVLMLFLVGLELEPKRLWSLRRPIFGWGSAQVLGCAAVLFLAGWAAGANWRVHRNVPVAWASSMVRQSPSVSRSNGAEPASPAAFTRTSTVPACWNARAASVRTCASLKLVVSEEPRCPEVPNTTRCSGTEASGLRS